MAALNCDPLYMEINLTNKIYSSFRNFQDISNPAALKTKN
jgi:hypothetical protein